MPQLDLGFAGDLRFSSDLDFTEAVCFLARSTDNANDPPAAVISFTGLLFATCVLWDFADEVSTAMAGR